MVRQLLVATILFVIYGLPSASDSRRTDTSTAEIGLEGEWTVAAARSEGVDVPIEIVKKCRVLVRGRRMEFRPARVGEACGNRIDRVPLSK
jgi:hypothetical protein